MSQAANEVPVIHGLDRRTFKAEVLRGFQPVVLKGLAADWPVVREAETSPQALIAYLDRFDVGAGVETFVGEPSIGGRFHYNDAMSGYNFARVRESFREALDRLAAALDDPDPKSVYIGSVTISHHLPGFERENAVDLVGPEVGPRIWLGNAATAVTHYDLLDNIACVVAGRRRFTFFPPEQVANLYAGPIDFTLAGQPTSMVSLSSPDFERYPRFREALKTARVVELEPGDAVYIPKLWWHNVQALDRLNGLVNYWWDHSRAGPDSGFTTLLHALMTISALPAAERAAWKAHFDHYAFRLDGHPLAHLAPEHRGILGDLTPAIYKKLKAHIITLMKR